jgi:hypothetical protein
MTLLPTEVLAVLVSLLSVTLALLAYRRSEKTLEIAKQANDVSTEANDIAKSQLSQTATDSDLLNTPGLSFRVWLDTTDVRTWRVITEITNTGRYSTEIVDGEVWLKLDEHPQRQYAQKLNGIKIAGLAKHIIEIKCKQLS